jgi:hypothetical protein
MGKDPSVDAIRYFVARLRLDGLSEGASGDLIDLDTARSTHDLVICALLPPDQVAVAWHGQRFSPETIYVDAAGHPWIDCASGGAHRIHVCIDPDFHAPT